MTFEELVTAAQQLSLIERVRLMEYLTASFKQDVAMQEAHNMPWHEFIEYTAGILADDPIERPPQLPFEQRDEFA